MDVRLVAGILLLGGAGAAIGWAIAAQPDGAGGDPGLHDVTVVGPDGVVWAGVVDVPGGTALSALEAAAAAGGFGVVVERRVSFTGEPCAGLYVASVAGHREEGTAGWMYDVVRGGEARSPPHSAACEALREGDAVVWRWVESGV